METIYTYSAWIGGGMLVLQTLLMLIGGDSDVDADLSPDVDVADGVDSSGILFQLSLKTVVAFVTFFGLAGLTCLQSGMGTNATLLTSVGAGLAAFFMVGWLMSFLRSLQSKGNLDLRQAVGSSAKVYLRIPGKRSGFGKVTVAVGGRVVTKKAVTSGDAIPTGAEVRIAGMVAPDTFEVSPTT